MLKFFSALAGSMLCVSVDEQVIAVEQIEKSFLVRGALNFSATGFTTLSIHSRLP